MEDINVIQEVNEVAEAAMEAAGADVNWELIAKGEGLLIGGYVLIKVGKWAWKKIAVPAIDKHKEAKEQKANVVTSGEWTLTDEA